MPYKRILLYFLLASFTFGCGKVDLKKSQEPDKPSFENSTQAKQSVSESASPEPSTKAKSKQSVAGRPRLGMNLNGPADWSTDLPFADVFRFSRTWISQKQDLPFGQGPKLELDSDGWVKKLEPGCWAETPLCSIDGGHYPSGRYTVLYEGEGELAVTGAASVVEKSPGKMMINVDSKRGGFFLQIRSTNPKRYVRNVRVLMPECENVDATFPWNPDFLKRWQGMACLHFMDLMQTNGSEIKDWNDRPKISDASWALKGVPVEVLIDLANRMQADSWFCIPHQANDNYVREFAKLIKDKLNRNLNVYVEYSNEVWNGGFVQHRYAGEQGQKLKFAEKQWEAAWRFNAFRSKQIFEICTNEIGPERLIRVLGSQAATPYVSEQFLMFQDAYKHADALAIAPYLSFNVSPDSKPVAKDVATWSVDQVLDYVEKHSLPESIGWMKSQKVIADKYQMPIIAYEGGQHLVGIAGAENNQELTDVLMRANAHPRMGGLYTRYLDAWTAQRGGLFCYFASTGRWSKWGSWGIVQFADDNPADSPKYMATYDWAKRQGQELKLPVQTKIKK